MLKKSSEVSCSIKLSKICFFVAIGVAILIAAIWLYVYILRPFFAFYVIPPKEYNGIEYYADGSYKNAEKGEIFFESFYSYDFADKCEIADFYYVDNSSRDNPLEGKAPDIYIIEVKTDTLHEEICQSIVEKGDIHVPDFDYEIYVMPTEYGTDTDCFYFAFNNEEQKIRYILITEMDGGGSLGVNDVVTIIYRRSTYEW